MREGSKIAKKANNSQKALATLFSNTLDKVIKSARILRGQMDRDENSCTCKKGFGSCSSVTVWGGQNYNGPGELKLTPENHSNGHGKWESPYGGNNGTVSCSTYCNNSSGKWSTPKGSTCTKAVIQRTGQTISCNANANQYKGSNKGLNPVNCTCSPPLQSMRIPDGCKVNVYSNNNETGATREYLGPLNKSTLKKWNNQVRSLVISSTADTKQCNPC
jgi:hypothetical protein